MIAPVILVASNLSTSKTEITKFNNKEIKIVEALTKLGAVVVAVAVALVGEGRSSDSQTCATRIPSAQSHKGAGLPLFAPLRVRVKSRIDSAP